MNLESYFNKLKSDFPDINLPGIFEAEDYNESQLKINGIWTNYLYGCGVIRKNDRYVYLGAYNYLVYLIEDPERALADLKAGLPTKDSSRFEKFIDQEELPV